MAELSEIGMNNETMLDALKQVKGEFSDCNYDEEMARLHLCLIGQLDTIDQAKDYWNEVNNSRINIHDWCVLWGEMVRRHGDKIKKWFPKISIMDFERKIFDECISFLDNGELPYYNLNV